MKFWWTDSEIHGRCASFRYCLVARLRKSALQTSSWVESLMKGLTSSFAWLKSICWKRFYRASMSQGRSMSQPFSMNFEDESFAFRWRMFTPAPLER